jgi:hypothetical protein
MTASGVTDDARHGISRRRILRYGVAGAAIAAGLRSSPAPSRRTRLGATTDGDFAEMGSERNGTFLG